MVVEWHMGRSHVRDICRLPDMVSLPVNYQQDDQVMFGVVVSLKKSSRITLMDFFHQIAAGGNHGYFFNYEERILLQFGKEVSVVLTVHAKLLAIQEGLLVVVISC